MKNVIIIYFLIYTVVLDKKINKQKKKLNKKVKTSNFPNIKTNKNKICDINIKNSICIGNTPISSLLGTPSLIHYFKFDTILLKSDINSNIHFKGDFKSGHGFNLNGSSAFFDNSNYLKLDNQTSLNKIPITYTFWIYIENNGVDKNLKTDKLFCPILLKGNDDSNKNSYLRNPGIYIKEGELSLRVFVSDSESKMKFAQSIGYLNSKEWNYISIILTKDKIKIYINGVLDGIQLIDDLIVKPNDLPLYLGTHPNYNKICNLAYYIDNLKIYNEEINEEYIFAEAGNVTGFLEPDYLKIGCINCDFNKAIISCKGKYHFCTNLEINSGGEEFIRRMNWNRLGKIISNSKYSEGSNIKGVGYCCKSNF